MRSKLLLFASLLMTISASAQNLPILKAQGNYVASGGSLQFSDTISHIHNSGRNSKINAPSHFYDFPNNGVYNADKSVVWGNGTTYLRTFNAAGLITSYKKTNLAGIPSEEIYYTYNSSMLLDTMTNGNSWRKVYSYNSSGLVSEVLKFSSPISLPGWVVNGRERYNYQNGKLVELITESVPSPGNWAPYLIDSFVANGSDSSFIRLQWNGSAYVEYFRVNYIRDANNNILTDGAHYYTYNAQGRMLTDSIGGSKTEYTYDAQSNLVRVKEPWLTSSPSHLDSFTYNGYNQVTSHKAYDSSNTNGPRLLNAEFFYYEFPVSVADVATQNALQLYPVPATSYINLSMQFTKSQAFSVRIFDMQGRLVNNWQEAAQKQYNKQIPVTNMAPGQYTVHILAGNESVSRQFTVVR